MTQTEKKSPGAGNAEAKEDVVEQDIDRSASERNEANRLEPARDQIAQFVHATFKRVSPGGVVAVCGILEFEDKVFRCEAIQLTTRADSLDYLVEACEDNARRAAMDPKLVAFAPPLATFPDKVHATVKDVVEALALSVACGDCPYDALEALIGPPTVIVQYCSASNGAVPLVDLHWRLATPARGNDRAKLKKVAALAHRRIGMDPSNTMFRWPGSWNRRTEELCTIKALNDVEIDLDAALAALTGATGGGKRNAGGNAAADRDVAISKVSRLSVLVTLRAMPNWVIWKWEPKKNGKLSKEPYQAAKPDKKAASTRSKEWSNFATAVAAAKHADGIGFMLPHSGIGAFDLDNCRDVKTGKIEPYATSLVERANSYTEITPSGTGLRIIGFGTGTKIHTKQDAPDGTSVETYRDAERYITMTGNVLPGTNEAFVDISSLLAEVDAELKEFNKRQKKDKDKDKDKSKDFDANANYEDIATDDPRLKKLDAKWIALGHDSIGIEAYSGHRSRAVMAFTCECFRAGIADTIIAACLMRWKIGEHIRDQANVTRALNRMIDRGRQFVTDSKLFEMNEKHAVLPIGGKTRVTTWGDDPDFPGRYGIVRSSGFDDFKALLNKYRHTFQGQDKKGNPVTITMGLGSWWLAQPHRRQYDNGMRFMPNRDEDVVNETLNLWQGFAVKTRKPEGKSGAAGCQLFLDHGLKIICSGNGDHFDYLMKREALIAQKRIRSEIAVGLQTIEEGTGKGFWCRNLNHLYGVHAMQVLNPEHVTGKHNKHLEVLLRLTADEALFARDPHHRNALYGQITEPTITIEPKFVDTYNAPNFLNIDVISNSPHFLPASGTARRFFVPTVSTDRAEDHEYFRQIEVQLINEGGYEALLYHLLHEIDIRDYNARAVPKTAMLAEQSAYSRKGIDLLVETACNEGYVPCQSYFLGTSDCAGYQERKGFDYFIDHHSDRELSRMGALMVKRRLVRDWGCKTGKATRKQADGIRGSGVEWPDLKELRAKFEKCHGKQQWLRPDVEVWIQNDEPF